MGAPSRAAVSIGGPRGGTTWEDYGDSFTLQNHGTISATTTTPGLFAAQTITRPNPFYQDSESTGITLQESLNPTTNTIQGLYGFQVTSSVLQAALTNLTLTLSVYRVVGTMNATGGAAATSLPLAVALTQTIPTSSTLTLTKVDGSASTTVTTNAAANIGATSISIGSTPNLSAYLTGSAIVWQVGGSPAFGWQGGVAQQGLTGSPAFPVGASVVAPIVAANTSLVTGTSNGVNSGWTGAFGAAATAGSGFMVLQAGDALMFNCVTSSSTATVQVLNIQPLII